MPEPRHMVSKPLPDCPVQAQARQGFSMSEMVIVIAILGVLALVIILSLGSSYNASKEVLAVARVEMLNKALLHYAMNLGERVEKRKDESITDELYVLLDLKFREDDDRLAPPGAPYIPTHYNPVASSNASDFRIRWTGRRFELLRPGQSGQGLLMNFEGTDFTTATKHPQGYQRGTSS